MSTITDTVESQANRAADVAKQTADTARGGFLDLAGDAMSAYRKIRKLDLDASMFDGALRLVGLARRSPGSMVAVPLAFFGAGIVVGGATAILLAPTSGKDLRARITKGAQELFRTSPAEEITDAASESADRMKKAGKRVVEEVQDTASEVMTNGKKAASAAVEEAESKLGEMRRTMDKSKVV